VRSDLSYIVPATIVAELQASPYASVSNCGGLGAPSQVEALAEVIIPVSLDTRTNTIVPAQTPNPTTPLLKNYNYNGVYWIPENGASATPGIPYTQQGAFYQTGWANSSPPGGGYLTLIHSSNCSRTSDVPFDGVTTLFPYSTTALVSVIGGSRNPRPLTGVTGFFNNNTAVLSSFTFKISPTKTWQIIAMFDATSFHVYNFNTIAATSTSPVLSSYAGSSGGGFYIYENGTLLADGASGAYNVQFTAAQGDVGFSQLNSTVFQPKCSTCHVNGKNNVFFGSYGWIMSDPSFTITPYAAENSGMVEFVEYADYWYPRQPKTFPAPDPVAEYQIRAWIQAGALDD
jgi:hypothetical protein